MTLTEQILALSRVCDAEEREMIEEMILASAAYIAAVVKMETAALNIAGRTDANLRDTVTETDRARTIAHDKLIVAVNIVNRICAMHDLPPIYTGSTVRREYGDFALALSAEIFRDRR